MLKQAVIYCRVSSDKQVKDGNGLDSQEISCRRYAEINNFKVIKVFKDEGVSGKLLERPELQNMLTFLAKNPKQLIAVVVDDISRIARDVFTHMSIRKEIAKHGAELHCVNRKLMAYGRFLHPKLLF